MLRTKIFTYRTSLVGLTSISVMWAYQCDAIISTAGFDTTWSVNKKLRNFEKQNPNRKQTSPTAGQEEKNKRSFLGPEGVIKWKCVAHMRSTAVYYPSVIQFPLISLTLIGTKHWHSGMTMHTGGHHIDVAFYFHT